MLTKHKEVYLRINGGQSLRLEKRRIQVPFKIYADFECNLKSVETYEGSYWKNIKITFPLVLLTNLFVLTMNLLS